MAKRGLRLVRSDFDITKEMIETGELFEGFTYVEAINRLFKWFMGEENLSFDEAIEATEGWLDENGVYYSHDSVVNKCKWCLDKKGELKDKLIKLDVVKIYENEVQMIKSLPNTTLQRAYFTMMVSCKLRKQRELEPWNKLYNSFNEFLSYCNGQISVKTEIESLNWLQQNGYIDVPLDDLSCYYYTGIEGSGKVVYELDGTKLAKSDFQKEYENIISKQKQPSKTMVIDLMQDSGYIIKDSREQVGDYLKEQGINTSAGNMRKIVKHEKYMVGDYTLVEISTNIKDEELELWLRGAEILQRSLQPYSRKAFKTIPSHIMRAIFDGCSVEVAKKEMKNEKEPSIKWCVNKKDDKQSLASKLRH